MVSSLSSSASTGDGRSSSMALIPRQGAVPGSSSRGGSPSLSLLYRKSQVFYCAAVVFADYQLCKWRCNQLSLKDDARRDAIWDETHARNAKFLTSQFLSLEGLWVKLGQYLSSRADVMPASYLSELSRCQDSLPPRPFRDIRSIIERELSSSLSQVFASVEESPLACASIAQVHRAQLINGRDVVIKVQHAHVANTMLQDLDNLQTIGDILKRLDADFDFSPVIREWAAEIPKELDFRQEASNMKRVKMNLASMLPSVCSNPSLTIDVSLPEVVEEFVTEKVLVMSYVNGFKVDSHDMLAKYNVNRSDVIRNITRSYAHQIFVNGFFSADPHPGNLLIQTPSLQPVLLDFGLTKEIDPKTRHYFAKLLVAAAEQDVHGLMDALDGVGLKLRPDVSFDIALLSKYFFRDANKKDVAQNEAKQRREENSRAAEERRKMYYAGDKVDVFRRSWLPPFSRTSCKGEVLRVEMTHSNEEDHKGKRAVKAVVVKLTDGSEVTVDNLDNISLQKSRSPIDAWPDSFIFFDRVLGLLRGLTAALDVSQSYLEVMTPYARKALQDHHHTEMSDKEDAMQQQVDNVRGVDTLNGKLSEALEDLLGSGKLLGGQLCVVKNGKVLVNLSAGVQSPYDLKPVTEETLFNCFSVTKAVAAFAVHLFIQRGLVSLEDPVCKHWPAFAQNNKENITISHVLNHCAGLATAGFDSLLADPFITSDADAMMYLMAESTADCPPGTEVKYHALSFGWLVAGIVKSVSGVSLRDFVRENIAEAIHMEEEMMIGLGDGGTKDLSIAPRLATLVLGRPSAASPPSSSKEKDEEKEGDVAGLTNGNSRRPPSSPSVLANPTFYNHPRLREAEIPAANGHFSAQALAFFYDKLGATATESSSSLQKRKEEFRGWKNGWAYSILEKSRKRGEAKVHGVEGESLLQGRSGSFVDGFTLFPSSDESSGVITLGHAGLGGSVAFVRIDVDTGDSLAVALTLNRLSTENNDTTYRILRTIYKELNIAIPSTYNQ